MAEDNSEQIAALEHERESYVAAGKADRVKQVDAELKRLGAKVKEPAARKGKEASGED